MILLDKRNKEGHSMYGRYTLIKVFDDGSIIARDEPTVTDDLYMAHEFSVYDVKHLNTKHSLSEFILDYEKDLIALKNFQLATKKL